MGNNDKKIDSVIPCDLCHYLEFKRAVSTIGEKKICRVCAARIEFKMRNGIPFEKAVEKCGSVPRLMPAFMRDFSKGTLKDEYLEKYYGAAKKSNLSDDEYESDENYDAEEYEYDEASLEEDYAMEIPSSSSGKENPRVKLPGIDYEPKRTSLNSKGVNYSRKKDMGSKDRYNSKDNYKNKKDRYEESVENIEIDLQERLAKMKPVNIKEMLDEYVIGQEEAKKKLAVACRDHYKRLFLSANNESDKLEKSDVMLIGPTGSGKTHLIRALAKILDVPLAVSVATELTEAGYVGKDVESILRKLILSAGGDVKKAEYGIVYIDEIDKLAGGHDSHKSVGMEGVQQALLTMVEGADIEVEMGSGMNQSKKVIINTNNILFICGGAFPAMEDIIRERLMTEKMPKHSSFGFQAVSEDVNSRPEEIEIDSKDIFTHVTTEDLKKFGMIPEFIGRFPVTAVLEELMVDDLVKILVEPKDSIVKMFKTSFEMDGIELEFEDSALRRIAEIAKEQGTGARSLKKIMEEKLMELKFQMPSRQDVSRIVIDREYIDNGTLQLYGNKGEQITL